MSKDRVVIIGAGQGGLQAAISLRQEGHEGPITLIGAEEGLPYQRPPLSKAYLKTGEAEKLALRPESFFEKQAIGLRAGTWVDTIDRSAKEVQIGDERVPYDYLILATGTRNLQPPIPGVEKTLGLRTLEDARILRAELSRPRKIAVIGGGFIGLKFAAVARILGHVISVAEAAPRLMARVLVLLAAGVRPNAELAEASGLKVANGVVTDALMRTEDPATFALGDCAVFPDPRTGRPVRLESVQAATDQARAIAKTITKGTADRYAAVPWFWSDQSDWKLQIAGLSGPDDACVAVGDDTVLRFAGENLTAVETINNAKTHMKARRLMAGVSLPSRSELSAVDFDLTRF